MTPDPAEPADLVQKLRQQMILAQVRIMELEDERDELPVPARANEVQVALVPDSSRFVVGIRRLCVCGHRALLNAALAADDVGRADATVRRPRREVVCSRAEGRGEDVSCARAGGAKNTCAGRVPIAAERDSLTHR